MKNKFIVILLLIGLFSCNDAPHEKPIKQDKGFPITYSIYTLDGCEYISASRKLTHKGNCKNKIHCYNTD